MTDKIKQAQLDAEANDMDDDMSGKNCEAHSDCSTKFPLCNHGLCVPCSECHYCHDGVDNTCGTCGEGYPTKEKKDCVAMLNQPMITQEGPQTINSEPTKRLNTIKKTQRKIIRRLEGMEVKMDVLLQQMVTLIASLDQDELDSSSGSVDGSDESGEDSKDSIEGSDDNDEAVTHINTMEHTQTFREKQTSDPNEVTTTFKDEKRKMNKLHQSPRGD